MKKKSFIGMSVASFLSVSLIAKFEGHVFIDEKPGLLSCLLLKYFAKLFIEVTVRDYAYMNPFDKPNKQLS